jgi:hypothetical protein
MQTSDIESEEVDIFKRKAKFEEISNRFNQHKQESLENLKGNDWKYNVYLKKLQKLVKYGKMQKIYS